MRQPQQEQEILQIALDAGRILLESGAEIFRVEDTVERICRHYELSSASVFVLSNGIFLTSGNKEETQFAKVLQIPVNNANLSRVAEVNQLSRKIEAGNCSLEEIRQELNRIEHMPSMPFPLQILASGIAAACFCYMFGGRWGDLLSSFIVGLLLHVYLLFLGKPHFSKIVCNITGSAMITFFIILFYKLGVGSHLEPMMISVILLMVPGVAFTNAIRDIADGDYISGSVRMLDAMLVFFCIAMGVGFVISLFGSLTGGALL